jgi:hypothetical protein
MSAVIIESYKRGDLLITLEKLGAWFGILSKMPGRKRWEDRNKLVCEPSGANIAFLLEHCSEADWREKTAELRDRYIRLKQEEENTRADKREQLVDDTGYEYRTVPYQHQKDAFLLSRDREAFALFHEQGTGKTKVIIDTAAYLRGKGHIDKLIVLAKNGVHVNWVLNEIPTHMPERIAHTRTWYSSNRKNLPIIQPDKKRVGKLHSITFPIEGFSSKFAEEWLWLGWRMELLCLWLTSPR